MGFSIPHPTLHIPHIPQSRPICHSHPLTHITKHPPFRTRTMQFSTLFTTVLSMVAVTSAMSGVVTWDGVYDQDTTSVYTFSCEPYLHSKGWSQLDMIPTFPDVGASKSITGWNSASCGTCYKLSYTPKGGKNRWLTMMAISTAQGNHDFVISRAGLDFLTDGKADALGYITVDYEIVSCPYY